MAPESKTQKTADKRLSELLKTGNTKGKIPLSHGAYSFLKSVLEKNPALPARKLREYAARLAEIAKGPFPEERLNDFMASFREGKGVKIPEDIKVKAALRRIDLLEDDQPYYKELERMGLAEERTTLLLKGNRLSRNIGRKELEIWKELEGAGLPVERIAGAEKITKFNLEAAKKQLPRARAGQFIVGSKIEGSPLSKELGGMNAAQCLSAYRQAREIISRMWALGIIHGHLHTNNFAVRYVKGIPKLTLIDFDRVKKTPFPEKEINSHSPGVTERPIDHAAATLFRIARRGRASAKKGSVAHKFFSGLILSPQGAKTGILFGDSSLEAGYIERIRERLLWRFGEARKKALAEKKRLRELDANTLRKRLQRREVWGKGRRPPAPSGAAPPSGKRFSRAR